MDFKVAQIKTKSGIDFNVAQLKIVSFSKIDLKLAHMKNQQCLKRWMWLLLRMVIFYQKWKFHFRSIGLFLHNIDGLIKLFFRISKLMVSRKNLKIWTIVSSKMKKILLSQFFNSTGTFSNFSKAKIIENFHPIKRHKKRNFECFLQSYPG